MPKLDIHVFLRKVLCAVNSEVHPSTCLFEHNLKGKFHPLNMRGEVHPSNVRGEIHP